MINLIGKSTIHPFFFYTGKISGYITWIILIIALVSKTPATSQPIELLRQIAISLAAIGLIMAIISLFNLGSSTRLGLPKEDIQFKKNGLYSISRNPMYLGFDLLTFSSILFFNNYIIDILGLYSIVIYHFIILGEEKYLDKKFSVEYLKYKKKTGRYF